MSLYTMAIRLLTETNNDAVEASARLAAALKADAALMESVLDEVIREAVDYAMRCVYREQRRTIRGVDYRTASNSAMQPLQTTPMRADTAAGYEAVAADSWLNYMIAGKRLGDLVKSECLAASSMEFKNAVTRMANAKFMKAIAAQLPDDDSAAVRKVLSDKQLGVLRAQAEGKKPKSDEEAA